MKIGRNDPCSCGSGKKYKKCCYGKSNTIPQEVRLQFEKLKAKQMQVEKQQGLGRSIISHEFNGYRMIAVGNRMWYSQKWKTFHDFLFEYIRHIFGKDWWLGEFAKPLEDRHLLIQWYELACKYMQQHQSGERTINNVPMSGAVTAIMSLSYNLYLLAHNVEIQDRLIKRLKDKNNFRGAQYETYVAAEFLKAGFELEIENEEDSRITHCEFTAISKKTGKKFSIEAKARQPNKNNVGISKQIGDALNKEAKYDRVIFIDINIPNFLNKMPEIIAGIKQKESSWEQDQNAYIFVTNHPFEYNLEGNSEHKSVLGHGFKIPEFCLNFQFTNLRYALKARERHIDMFDLIRSVSEHEEIPSTFDGDHPEFVFAGKDALPRLVIGQKYLIPDKEGQSVEAILETATVSEHEKKVMGVYRTTKGEGLICTNPLTDEELIAYRRQPDTFFGVPLQQTRKAKDPIDLFDFFYGSYKVTPRERLLEFMKDRVDIEALKNLNDEELRIAYCERLVYSAINQSKSSQRSPFDSSCA